MLVAANDPLSYLHPSSAMGLVYPPPHLPIPSLHSIPHPSQSSSHMPSTSLGGGKMYQCDTCGKAYKHPNCLSKHKWEHTEHWKEASKFSLSKHQQVQMLEAASILMGLTSTSNTPDMVPNEDEKSVMITNEVKSELNEEDGKGYYQEDEDDGMLMQMDV